MNDNLFEQLFELFQSPGPVNYRLAAEIMRSLTGGPEPIEPKLAEEYQELTLAAQLHIDRATALGVSTGGEINPTDRRSWAESNEQSFRFLVEPLGDKLAAAPGDGGPLGAIFRQLGPAILGMQLGSMLGFMSHRVLGQFDVGLPAMDRAGLFLVVPNLEAFAVDHGLDPHETRLWAALHEVAHHTILSVDWVREHFRSLVDAYFAELEVDPSALGSQMESLEDPEQLQLMLQQPGGFARLFGGEDQPENLGRVQAFTAFVEGYGDYTVAQAADGLLAELPKLDEAFARHRAEPNQGEQFLQQLVGLDLQRHRARDAAAFCAEVARRWGEESLAGIWDDPERLPTVGELEDPVGWAARVLLG